MRHFGIRRSFAWLLAAMLLLGAPGCAEALEAAADAVEAAVSEVGEVDLYDPAIYGAPSPGAEPEDAPAADDSAEAEDALDIPVPAADAPIPEAAEAEEEATGAEAPGPLALNADSLTLGAGETFVLTAAVALPEGAAEEPVRFQSSDAKIAAVNASTGRITAKKTGSATVTATVGELRAACAVQVVKAPSKVTLSPSKATLGVGETLQLAGKLPSGAASKLTWQSGKPSVASVDPETGLVAANKAGTATITAKTFNGKKASCKITVKPAPASIALEPAELTLSVGQVRTLAAKLSAGSAGTWTLTVNAPEVAAVEGRMLTALGPGTATVTAQAYNGVRAELLLHVVDAPTELLLPQAEATLGVGEKLALSPSFDADAPVDLTYASSKSKVAAVSKTGVVSAKKTGSATVTVTSHNGLTASLTVRVVKAPSKVTLSSSKATLGVGETLQLVGKLPSGAASKLAWQSGKPSVASVDPETGLVAANQAGTATVTVKTFNGKKATCKITVKDAPMGVVPSLDLPVLAVGQTTTARAALSAGSAGAVTFESADPSVASADGAAIVANAPGETRIIATAYNGVSGTATVRVVPAPSWIALNAEAVTLGVGEKFTVVPAVDADSQTSFAYKSSAAKVASASASGVITAKKKGAATITVTTHNGLSADLPVKVAGAPSKIALSPAKLSLELGDAAVLTARLPAGTSSRVTYSSSNPAVATVDADGTVVAEGVGTATITAKTFNGKKASCKITVRKATSPPATPGGLTAEALSPTSLAVSWTGSVRASGYRVYVGGADDVDGAELYGDYDASARRATVRGLAAGQLCRVFVTARNDFGESPAETAAVQLPASDGAEGAVTLDAAGVILLRRGAQRTLTAACAPDGAEAGLSWETTAAAIAAIAPDGAACVVTAERTGAATVTAELPGGASASVTVVVVDTADLTDSNLTAVQKLLLRHEELMEEDAGGGVIWELISGRLTQSNLMQSRVKEIVARVKSAANAFRSIFVYAFGSYDIVGEATYDKQGNPVSTSYFSPADDTLYLHRSTTNSTHYAYTMLHEVGHAVDYNAEGNSALSSLNNDAVNAITADVRNLLTERIADAAADAGVDIGGISANRVIDAVMDYRELLHHDEIMATMTADEQTVYDRLIANVRAEMNEVLPTNNGTMVWDAVEGTTNFAISGNFGHAYMFSYPQYRQLAYYYFYDRSGNPSITSEPWAEYFSANLMQDETTIGVNLTYLPETCRYFAETLVPKVLDYFKSWVKAK